MRRKMVLALAAVLGSLSVTLATAGLAPASEEGEVWVTSQGTHRLFIVHGLHGQGRVETLNLPTGTGPHLINFSPDGEYAYVSGMGNGDLDVIRADDRQLVTSLNFGGAGTHQAMPSPDGETLLVAQTPSKKLIKVAANEARETWVETGQLTLTKSPICTIFSDDGQRAYVSLLPSGIQVVDVATMTPLGGEIATDGTPACGMVKEHNGSGIMLASSGGGGHVYRLDFATGTLDSRGTLGASDWHSFRMSPSERLGFGTVPAGDEVRLIDLTSDPVTSVALPLDPTAGAGNDEPDHMAVHGNTLYATLRESGKLAIVQVKQRTVDYLQLSPANPSFNPANCAGCAVHGVALRFDRLLLGPTKGMRRARPGRPFRIRVRARGGRLRGVQVVVRDARGRAVGRSRRFSVGERRKRVQVRVSRRLGPGRYRIAAAGRDGAGRRVRAVRRVRWR